LRFYMPPTGEAYKQVIDLAIRNSDCFVLKQALEIYPVWDTTGYMLALEELQPYLIHTHTIPAGNMEDVIEAHESYRSSAFYTAGIYRFYRCSENSGKVLKELADGLSDWKFPNLPEDLCFLMEGGGDYLYSIVHENLYGLEVSEEEATMLMDQNPGLFLELENHHNLDRLLEDAIKQKGTRLSISGHGLKSLPDDIRYCTELVELDIFEQDLYELPEALFELSKLEILSIMTADLACIPSSIGKLKNLRELRIVCASSDRPAPGWTPKPIHKISLNRIPPEIGELQRLEVLAIQYSSIDELPQEIEKLKNLRHLMIAPSLLRAKPDFLSRMKDLSFIYN
jgi:hypothetical protein